MTTLEIEGKRVKEELINEFAVSNMDIETFSQMHSIQPEAMDTSKIL